MYSPTWRESFNSPRRRGGSPIQALSEPDFDNPPKAKTKQHSNWLANTRLMLIDLIALSEIMRMWGANVSRRSRITPPPPPPPIFDLTKARRQVMTFDRESSDILILDLVKTHNWYLVMEIKIPKFGATESPNWAPQTANTYQEGSNGHNVKDVKLWIALRRPRPRSRSKRSPGRIDLKIGFAPTKTLEDVSAHHGHSIHT